VCVVDSFRRDVLTSSPSTEQTTLASLQRVFAFLALTEVLLLLLHQFNGLFSGTTLVSQYQKGKINLDFTEARDSEWQWHQLGHMQVCTSLQTDNHANAPPLSYLQAGCPSCRPANSIKALKAIRKVKPVWI